MSLLECLIIVSEKAANIARVCRQEECLFKLLIQEKSSAEANPRFVQDFKTLADVLIQETVKYEIGKKFPELKNSIKGEEDNTFCNTLGDSITIEIQNTPEATSELLSCILNDNKTAASLLSAEVHKDVQLNKINTIKPINCDNEDLVLSSLGIWIDPIDCTNEYIRGTERENVNGIHVSGLHCVTVLIGVYNKISGKPIIGVINQPFFQKQNDKWIGKCFWGFSSFSSEEKIKNTTNIICISSTEDLRIKNKLIENGYKLVEASGAGYKILTVINGYADAYILTKNSTFMWDTCGPQAILNAFKGDILIYDKILNGNEESVVYHAKDNSGKSKIDMCCNVGGVLAYRNEETLRKIIHILRE